MTDAIRTLPDAALIFGAFCTASVMASLVLFLVLGLHYAVEGAHHANTRPHSTTWDLSDRAAQEAADRVPDDPERPARIATHQAGIDEYLPREDRS